LGFIVVDWDTDSTVAALLSRSWLYLGEIGSVRHSSRAHYRAQMNPFEGIRMENRQNVIMKRVHQSARMIGFAAVFIAPLSVKASVLNGRTATLWPPEYQQESNTKTEPGEALVLVEQLNTRQIREVQQQLNAHGHQVGEINGQWNPQTEVAMRNFQRSQGIQVSGQLDEKTVERLGLNVDNFRPQERS
jgi:hypothetical protein